MLRRISFAVMQMLNHLYKITEGVLLVFFFLTGKASTCLLNLFVVVYLLYVKKSSDLTGLVTASTLKDTNNKL